MRGVDALSALTDTGDDRFHYSAIVPVGVFTGDLFNDQQVGKGEFFDRAVGKICYDLKAVRYGVQVVNAQILDEIENLAFGNEIRMRVLSF